MIIVQLLLLLFCLRLLLFSCFYSTKNGSERSRRRRENTQQQQQQQQRQHSMSNEEIIFSNGLFALVLQMHLRIVVFLFSTWLVTNKNNSNAQIHACHFAHWSMTLLAYFPSMTESNKLLWLNNRLMRLRK